MRSNNGGGRRQRRRGPGAERGAAMVEFALVVPIFLLLVMGVIDFGATFNDYNSVRQGVREGARQAVVADWTLDGCTGTASQKVSCVTKERIDLDSSRVRVKVQLEGDYEPGDAAHRVCHVPGAQHDGDVRRSARRPGADLQHHDADRADRRGRPHHDVCGDRTEWGGLGMVLKVRRTQHLGQVTRRREERGAIIVVAALMMTALLGMSAIAIDITNARQQQRQAQGSADAAALAAAQDLPDPNATVATVKQYAADNFDTPASAWSGCQDPDHLAELPDSGNGNSCISIDEAFSRVRVRHPEPRRVDVLRQGPGRRHGARQRIRDRGGAAHPRRPHHPGHRGGVDRQRLELHRERRRQRRPLQQERQRQLRLVRRPPAQPLRADLAGRERLAAHQLLHGRRSRAVHLRHRIDEGLRLLPADQEPVLHDERRERQGRQPPAAVHRQRRATAHRRPDRQRHDQHRRRREAVLRPPEAPRPDRRQPGGHRPRELPALGRRRPAPARRSPSSARRSTAVTSPTG